MDVELLLKYDVNIHANNNEALRFASLNGHKDGASENGRKDVVELLLKPF